VSRLFTDAHEPLPPNPALLGFSFSWELDYTNVMGTLEKQGIPVRSEDRTDDMPLVFGGGPVLTANPEPYAEFFDVVLLVLFTPYLCISYLIRVFYPVRTFLKLFDSF
jgi:hypothetical protein